MRDKVVEAVRADLLARSEKGIKKYGETLDMNRASLRGRLQHLYEEQLDAANYTKWAIMRLDEGVNIDTPCVSQPPPCRHEIVKDEAVRGLVCAKCGRQWLDTDKGVRAMMEADSL